MKNVDGHGDPLIERMLGGRVEPRGPGITNKSLGVFLAYAKDAGNWSGTPLIGGNVGGTKEERGNLTQLKRAKLITTFRDDGCDWLCFTDAGKRGIWVWSRVHPTYSLRLIQQARLRVGRVMVGGQTHYGALAQAWWVKEIGGTLASPVK